MDELAGASADIVSSATKRVRSFRAMSPRTRDLFAAPLHSHEAPSIGVGGVPLEMTTTYDTGVLGLDNALEVLEARERGGSGSPFTTGIPFSALIVDDTAAVVDTTYFEGSGRLGPPGGRADGSCPERPGRPVLGPRLAAAAHRRRAVCRHP